MILLIAWAKKIQEEWGSKWAERKASVLKTLEESVMVLVLLSVLWILVTSAWKTLEIIF